MCGIFGIFGHEEAANLTYLGLYSLQHRGQEAAGITTFDGEKMHVQRRQGLVVDGFSSPRILAELPGDRAIGHVRYSTAGGSDPRNAQPLTVNYRHGLLAVSHNGNILNAGQWRHGLESMGAIFQTFSDTEIILHLMSRSQATNLEDRIIDSLRRVRGAYSMLFLNERKLIAARDPWGYRPLVMGRLGDAVLFSSENSSFSLVGARFEREVQPGELILVDKNGVQSMFPFRESPRRAQCIFEHVYFARPDSTLFGTSVYASRVRAGELLAKEHPVEADVVIPIPDSGIAAAIGYSRASGIPFGMGLIRSHYVGRTFIEPSQSIRSFGVKLKLSPVREVLEGKRVVVVDDSLVRGTTSRKIMELLRSAGAREIHARICSPPVTHSCFYGIDTPTRQELIGARKTQQEIAEFITTDTLGYLSREHLLESVQDEDAPDKYCSACFSGNYPEDPHICPPMEFPQIMPVTDGPAGSFHG